MSKSDVLKNEKEGLKYSPEQLMTKYFNYNGGCFQKQMTNEEYYNLVIEKQKSLNLYQRALKKIGLDEEELKDIPPIKIVGFVPPSKKNSTIVGPNGYFTNKYETTWLMFSNKEIYVYNYIFNMLSQSVKEHIEEYFYKDITNITTIDEDIEIKVPYFNKNCLGQTKKDFKKIVKQISSLKIIVPGDIFTCSIDPNENEEIENKIKAVKAKLREVKG